MKIDPDEFCYLAKSETFLVWLRGTDANLYADLVNFLKSGQGCTANKKKMLAVLNILIQNRASAMALEQFIRQNFPAMIIGPRTAISKGTNKHQVFSYYDPALTTFPRRMILVGADLPKKIRDFCSKQFYYEYVIVEDYAYIEYIPPEAVSLKSSIPDKNWQIRSFKNRSIKDTV